MSAVETTLSPLTDVADDSVWFGSFEWRLGVVNDAAALSMLGIILGYRGSRAEIDVDADLKRDGRWIAFLT